MEGLRVSLLAILILLGISGLAFGELPAGGKAAPIKGEGLRIAVVGDTGIGERAHEQKAGCFIAFGRFHLSGQI